jgi:hypothetical protein
MRPVVIASTLLLALASTALAQNNKKFITDAKDAGPDFAFQGEYVGKIEAGPDNLQVIGLQVTALGSGRFYALQYIGGLPGETTEANARVALQGTRKGNSVLLEGWPMSITVHRGGYASVHYVGGSVVGELLKVNRKSPMNGACPPAGATVLFDGKNTDHWQNGKMTDDGLLKAGTRTKKSYQNFKLHLEFRVPYVPDAQGQARGNSGVYLQNRYEVQILDSFALPILNDGAGALYKLRSPDINASLPPLEWQSYDIEFQGAEFAEDGRKTKDARITVCHNGWIVHDGVDLLRKTGSGRPEGPEPGPIVLQDHGNPVVFRNIWIVDLDNQCDPCDPCCQQQSPTCKMTCGCDACGNYVCTCEETCHHEGHCRKPASAVKKETKGAGDCCGMHFRPLRY